MRSILLKDYLEQRFYFLILLVVAVVSMLLAAYFKQLDSGVAMVLLFVLQGPLFVYLASNHQINSEVSNNTLPFLQTLPISPFKLWLAKLLFVLVYSTLLYLAYLVIGLASGVEASELYQLFITYPSIGIGIPAVAISFGFFTTMLPRGFAMLAFLIMGSFAAPIFLKSATLVSMNLEILMPMLTLLFLTCSAFAFLVNKPLTTAICGLKGIALLAVGCMIMLGAWSTLSSLADNNIPALNGNDSYGVPMDGGNVFLQTIAPEVSWYDVVNIRDYNFSDKFPRASMNALFQKPDTCTRPIISNLRTGTSKQIAPRNSYSSNHLKNFNNEFAIISRSIITAGFYRGQENVVIDKNGDLVLTLPKGLQDQWRDIEYDNTCKLIDDQRFIFMEEIKNGKSIISEFTFYEKGKGQKVVYSSQDDFWFYDFIVMPAKESGQTAQVFISGISDSQPGQLVLISVPDGKKYLLPNPNSINFLLAGSDFILSENRKRAVAEPAKTSFSVIYLDGRVIELDWIASNTEFISITSENKIIALVPYVGNEDNTWYAHESLIEIDILTRTSRDLLKFESFAWVKYAVNSARTMLILHSSVPVQENVEKTYHSINLLSGATNTIKTKDSNLHALDSLYATSGNLFIASIYGQFHEIDAEKLTMNFKFGSEELAQIIKKGGLQK